MRRNNKKYSDTTTTTTTSNGIENDSSILKRHSHLPTNRIV